MGRGGGAGRRHRGGGGVRRVSGGQHRLDRADGPYQQNVHRVDPPADRWQRGGACHGGGGGVQEQDGSRHRGGDWEQHANCTPGHSVFGHSGMDHRPADDAPLRDIRDGGLVLKRTHHQLFNFGMPCSRIHVERMMDADIF